MLPDQIIIDAVDHLLADAPWARERMMPFAGDVVHIDAAPFDLRARITDDGLLAAADAQLDASVHIRLPIAELPAALAAGGMGRAISLARIDGDAELAEALGFVFRNLEWDVEEDLARVVGDIPAHRLAGAARSLRSAAGRGREALEGNLGEYLTEEAALLVRPEQVAALGSEISELRDALARLEKRIERAARRLHERR